MPILKWYHVDYYTQIYNEIGDWVCNTSVAIPMHVRRCNLYITPTLNKTNVGWLWVLVLLSSTQTISFKFWIRKIKNWFWTNPKTCFYIGSNSSFKNFQFLFLFWLRLDILLIWEKNQVCIFFNNNLGVGGGGGITQAIVILGTCFMYIYISCRHVVDISGHILFVV
jgi:hypothetical protein